MKKVLGLGIIIILGLQNPAFSIVSSNQSNIDFPIIIEPAPAKAQSPVIISKVQKEELAPKEKQAKAAKSSMVRWKKYALIGVGVGVTIISAGVAVYYFKDHIQQSFKIGKKNLFDDQDTRVGSEEKENNLSKSPHVDQTFQVPAVVTEAVQPLEREKSAETIDEEEVRQYTSQIESLARDFNNRALIEVEIENVGFKIPTSQRERAEIFLGRQYWLENRNNLKPVKLGVNLLKAAIDCMKRRSMSEVVVNNENIILPDNIADYMTKGKSRDFRAAYSLK